MAREKQILISSLSSPHNSLRGGDVLVPVPHVLSFNGTSRNCRARLLASGTLDSTFIPVPTAIAEARTCVVQPDGNIVFGGFFYYTAGDTPGS